MHYHDNDNECCTHQEASFVLVGTFWTLKQFLISKESLNNTGKLSRIITCLLAFNGSQSIIFHSYDMKVNTNFHKKNCFEGQLSNYKRNKCKMCNVRSHDCKVILPEVHRCTLALGLNFKDTIMINLIKKLDSINHDYFVINCIKLNSVITFTKIA